MSVARNRVTVDDITREVMNRALADFNCRCAAYKLGHWPDGPEAIKHFLDTPTGLKDALLAVGAEEYPITTFVPPEERIPIHSD